MGSTSTRFISRFENVLDFVSPTHAKAWDPEVGFVWDDSGCKQIAVGLDSRRVKSQASFTRTELARELDQNLIGNRMLFGGNLVRQPAFVQLRKDRPDAMRVVGQLSDSDNIMNTTLFLGTYPGLTHQMIEKEENVIQDFCSRSLIKDA